MKFTNAAVLKLSKFHEELNNSGMKPAEAVESRAGNSAAPPALDSLVSGIGAFLSNKIIGANSENRENKNISATGENRAAEPAAVAKFATSPSNNSNSVSFSSPISNSSGSIFESEFVDGSDSNFDRVLSVKKVEKSRSIVKPVEAKEKTKNNENEFDFSWDQINLEKPAENRNSTSSSSNSARKPVIGKSKLIQAKTIEEKNPAKSATIDEWDDFL